MLLNFISFFFMLTGMVTWVAVIGLCIYMWRNEP